MTHRWRWIPNALTFLRILLIAPFAAALMAKEYRFALVIFFLASATDAWQILTSLQLLVQSDLARRDCARHPLRMLQLDEEMCFGGYIVYREYLDIGNMSYMWELFFQKI